MTNWETCPAVERRSEKLSGAWVFQGTRVPVSALFENLKEGASIEQFLDWFPGVGRIKSWSLTSLQHRLMKTGGRLVKHARYYWLLLAKGHLNRRLFGDMLHRIWALPVPGG